MRLSDKVVLVTGGSSGTGESSSRSTLRAGKIVNIASFAAVLGIPEFSLYCALMDEGLSNRV